MIHFPPFFDKGDNFSDALFAFEHTNPLPKRGLLQKERIYSKGGANSFLLE